MFRRGEEASAEVARLVPAGRLLVETDSPYLAPPGVPRYKPAVATPARPASAAGAASDPGAATAEGDPTAEFHGRRNSPEWVRIIGEWVAECRAETPDSIGAGLVEVYDAAFRSRCPGLIVPIARGHAGTPAQEE